MEKKNNLYKFLMYLFLVLVVIGFTLPSFLDVEEEQTSVSPRICQADADCYLICDEKPLAVLCYHNLCQQNSCQEASSFPYQAAQNQLQLEILINQTKLDLKEQFEKLSLNNFFVEFQKDSLVAKAPNLSLSHLLDQLGMKIDAFCLKTKEESYCQDKEHQLALFVNSNRSYSYGDYEIKDGDKIKIIYN